ncbi:MAG: hypothetical protein V1797_13935 [Pseudomonadota bacterium]
MPLFDIRTMALTVAILFFVLSAYLAQFRLTRPSLPGVGRYALGCLFCGLGMVLLLPRGLAPDFITVVVANVLLGLFSTMVFLGLAEFLGHPSRAWPHVLAITALAVGLALFTYVWPSTKVRVVLISLVGACYTLTQAGLLWRFSAPVVGGQNWALFCFTFVMGLVFLARAGYTAFIEQNMGDLMQAGLVHGLTFLAFILGGLLVMIGLVFLAVQRLELEARRARAEVHQLSGLLPICSSCKRIRDDQGYWHQVEAYVRDHSEADFTHGICPDCVRRLYPEVASQVLERKKPSGGQAG